MISLGYIIGFLYLVLILSVTELITKYNKSPTVKFITRKSIHIAISLEWFILDYFFSNSIHWVIFTGILTLLLFVFHRFFNSISDDNNSFNGSLSYCFIAMVLSFASQIFPDLYYFFGLSLCALSYGDGFAGLIGYLFKNHNITLYKNKTLIGSLCAFSFTLLTMILFKYLYVMDIAILEIIIISLIFSFVELITPYDMDNISTPLITMCLLILTTNTTLLYDYAFSFITIPLTAVFIINKDALTKGGIISALCVSLIILYTLGDPGFILLFSFFFITSIADLIKRNKKKELLKDMHDKIGKRDYKQVLACGLIPSIIGILHYITKQDLFILLYVTALGENLADCLASEIGVLSKSQPLDICKFKLVDTGLSGGISLLGSLSSILGVLIITGIYFFLPINKGYYMIIIISSTLGVILDSILGSIVQRKNICPICNKITEKNEHCLTKTNHHSGVKWIDNSMVNLMSNVFSIAVCVCLYFIFK